MLEDLIQEYIAAMHEANLRKMLQIEKAINGLGMNSADLRAKVKELNIRKAVS